MAAVKPCPHGDMERGKGDSVIPDAAIVKSSQSSGARFDKTRGPSRTFSRSAQPRTTPDGRLPHKRTGR
eukprot:scaffold28967_cov118-Isochrysis_galbana.AAC.1